MERVMSVEERIKRAEERYNKKIGQESNISYRKDNIKEIKQKKKTKRKLILQMFICIIIYICFYCITNSDYIFSEKFKSDVNSFFTEKTKIYSIYSDIESYIKNEILKTNENQKQENNEQNLEKQQKIEDNVGGAEDDINVANTENSEEIKNEENIQKTQMEKDVDEIKSKVNFINPIEGRISSTFGWRNPTVSTVPKYHTGLDIAAVTGTIIKSATDGVVSLVSSAGDYGKHYYVTNQNITIIYAHCSKLYLKEGDIVEQGQEIAEVGSTGNSTGPHLHIGIKLDDRWVDPQMILNL